MAPEETVAPRVKSSARVVEAPTSPPILPTTVSRLFSGFVLRAGVFTNAQRAEELHAKLTLSGVPSTVESRVQVGPFRTRQEAEAAQAKLKELGIETILLPPKGARP
jgi:DedD protein